MRFGILGPLEVRHNDRPHRLGGPKQRTLLAALLVQANGVVSAEYLASVLWDDDHPRTGVNALHTHVSRLRTLLDEVRGHDGNRLVSRNGGYLLRVDDDELDCAMFESASRRALAALAAHEWTEAAEGAEAALGYWRGAALEQFCHLDFARARAAQLEEQRLVTVECRVDAGLALGRHRELTGDLQDLVTRYPLRESLWCQLMLALYRSGRQSDALRAYERVRRLLAEELGIKPCGELVRLERAVLDQDPSLDWHDTDPAQPAAAGAVPAGTPLPEPPAHNLPRPSTSFVGRDAERAMIAAALERSRLVTLSGSGGCGKTRLALAVADAVHPRFAEGVWFVDLAAVDEPSLVPRAIARPLGSETGRSDQLDHLCHRIGDDRMLLVLDNCEHVAQAVVETVEHLLSRCGAVRILATSRENLGVGPELAVRVPALSLPVADGDDHEPFLNSEAVQLFVERGRARVGGFSATGDALDEVASICQRLAGMPLAIELAAAQIGDMPVADIAERLDDRFRLLAHGRRGLPRPQILQTTLDWSYDLLAPEARDVFVRLAVFVDGFSPAAVRDVAGAAATPRAVERILDDLVARSLVAPAEPPGGGRRYRLLETVRQYAEARLGQLGAAEDAHHRHARHYAALAAEAEGKHYGAAGDVWLPRVVSELPNLRAAVAWCLAQDDLETAMRLASPLRWYFARIGLLDEADGWFDQVLPRAGELPADVRLRVLTAAGTVAIMRGDFRRLRQLGDEGPALARSLGDERELAAALVVRGGGVGYEGDLGRADECFAEARELWRHLGDRSGLAWTLMSWGLVSSRANLRRRARDLLEESLELFRALDDRHGQVLPLAQLALDAHEDGHNEQALALAGEAARLSADLQDPQLQHVSLHALGTVELARGRPGRARDLLVRSIRFFPGARSEITVGSSVEKLARLAGRAGRHGEAVALLGFTRRLYRTWQVALTCPPNLENQRLLDAARAALGAERVERELERGQAMELDDAVRLAEAATDTVLRSA